MQSKIIQYFYDHEKEMADHIFELIKIESVKSDSLPGMPFGKACAEALEAVGRLAENMGFSVKKYDNYVLTIDLNDKPSKLDMLVHMDVVPAIGQDWTVTKPFSPVIMEGKLYGRGAADDKGPAIAALYTMKAVRDLNIPLSYNVRLIVGADEESGSSDIAYYYQKEKAAEMTFSPDSDFPVINCEKGGYWSAFSGTFAPEAHPVLLELHGGERGNAVPAGAWARLEGIEPDTIRELCGKVQQETSAGFNVTDEENVCLVNVSGTAAHASTPEAGNNAITALLQLLCELGVKGEGGTGAVTALARLFPHGEFSGAHAKIAMEDQETGKLTLGLNILDYDGTKVDGRIDCRVPICATEENVVKVLDQEFSEAGLSLSEKHLCHAHYVPEDSEFVRQLLKCYEQYTGQKGYCISTGGMTYTHHVKNGVAFGCTFPGRDPHMHGADECISMDDLKMSGAIFAQAIADLCK